jgi:putative ABC transport system permease protein
VLSTLGRALRSLRRAPTFLTVSTLSLGVGLGLSTATFAIVDSDLHPAIPLVDVDRLFYARLRLGNQKTGPSLRERLDALSGLPAVEVVAAAASERRPVLVNGSESWRLVQRMSPDLFTLLGVRPVKGRLPNPEEIRTQGAVVVSRFLWHSLFADRAEVEGTNITIGDRIYSVVGVLPQGVERVFAGDVWIPTVNPADVEGLGSLRILAKLRPGTDSIAVRPQLATIASNFTAAYVSRGAPPYVLQLQSIRPAPDRLRDSDLHLLLLFVSMGILAIAASNVAALTLARGLTRRRDHALRIALGSSRLAIGGEVLAEVTMVGVLGAALGVVVAVSLLGMFTHSVPEDLTWSGYFQPRLSPRVFAWSAAGLVAAIGFAGSLPAWRASRATPSGALKDNAGTTTGRSRSEFRWLVIGELAVSMVLLMLASLVSLSTANIANYQFGYDARRLLNASVGLRRATPTDSLSTAQRLSVQVATLERIRRVRGVEAAATMSGGVPDQREVTSDVGREAAPLPLKSYMDVSPGFFSTLGVRMLEGRDFSEGDRMGAGAIVLSKRAARALFPHGSAVGRLVKLGGDRSARAWLPVVGVVRDIEIGMRPNRDLELEPGVFASTNAPGVTYWSIAIRPARPDSALPLALQRELADMLPARSSSQITAWLSDYAYMLRIQRFFERGFSFLSTAALLLGASGLFSVLTYAVGQRMREFAVRMALGATRANVLRLVLRSGFELALGGTAIGALLSFWASSGVSAMLYGVKNTDPVALVVAEGTLLLVTMLACLAPALRATRADPVEILRSA